jgi:hypothetical protein
MRQGLPDGGNGLPEAMSGLLRLFISPEQRRNCIPRMGLSRPEREIGEKRPGFSRGKGQGQTRRESAFKTSKQAKCEQPHTSGEDYITLIFDGQVPSCPSFFDAFFDESLMGPL